MRRSRRRGAVPSSAAISAAARGSTWRPFSRPRTPLLLLSPEVSITGSPTFMLVQEIAMRIDVRGEVERMLAHEALRELGVASLQSLDDAHMVDDRALSAIAARDRHPADRAHMDEKILDRLAHEVRAGKPDDRLVERDVRIRIVVDVLGRRRAAELVEHVAQRPDVLGGGVDRRKGPRHALERRPHFDHLDNLPFRLPDDENAVPRHGAQESLLFQQRHRFADRRAAHTERLAQLPFVEPDLFRLAVDVGILDRLLQRGVRLVAKALLGIETLQRQCGRGHGPVDRGRKGLIIHRKISVDNLWYTKYVTQDNRIPRTRRNSITENLMPDAATQAPPKPAATPADSLKTAGGDVASQPQETDGFQLVIDALKLNGIDTIFGLPGIPITDLTRRMQANGLRVISFRHEQNAGYAASIAGFMTQKPGICLTVSAPGFLNGLTALANATTNCFPMILVSGSSEREVVDLQQGDYEEMDQLAIAKPLCKAAFRVLHAQDIGIGIARAIRSAVSGRPGGVYLDLPAKLFGQVMDAEAGKKTLIKVVDPAPKQIPAPDAVKRALEVLKSAKRPLIILGKGAAYAQADEQIRAFVEKSGAPFLPMSMGKGLLPDTHPQCAGAARSTVLKESDVVMLIGARLNWLLSHRKGKTWVDAPMMFNQMDSEPKEMASNVEIAAPVVGDIGSCVSALVDGMGANWPAAPAGWINAVTPKGDENNAKMGPRLANSNSPMDFHGALGALRTVIKERPDAILVNEGANTLDLA